MEGVGVGVGPERPKYIFFVIVCIRAVKVDFGRAISNNGQCKTLKTILTFRQRVAPFYFWARSLAVALGWWGKYGGNGGNLSHFGNIIISPDRRADPGHAEKLSLRYVFFNTFPIFHFFNFTSTTLCNATYIFSGERWKW